MVDSLNTYNGSFANTEVSNNTIQGQRLFGVGIAVGSCVWVPCSATNTKPPLSGPVTISNNVFSGSIAFPIPISGWTGGITVRRHKPPSEATLTVRDVGDGQHRDRSG